MGQPHVAADDRSLAERDSTQDGRASIDHHIVFNNRMAGVAFHESARFIDGKPLGSESDSVIKPHAVAQYGPFRR